VVNDQFLDVIEDENYFLIQEANLGQDKVQNVKDVNLLIFIFLRLTYIIRFLDCGDYHLEERLAADYITSINIDSTTSDQIAFMNVVKSVPHEGRFSNTWETDKCDKSAYFC
jgi:hypothetical protein